MSRQRIRLRPEELKESNRITPKEKIVAYIVAVIEAVATVWIVHPNGLSNNDKLSLPLMAAALIGFVACVYFTNRLGAMLGALGVFAMFAVRFQLEVIYAYPLMGYMLYLTLASTKARQKIQAERAAKGDFVDGMAEARANRSSARAKPTYATTDAAGKSLAEKSKRYTPPKAKKQ